MLSHYWLPIQHGSEILGSEVHNGLYEVKFMVVHVPRIAHILTKSASSMETKSSQLCLLWKIFNPLAQGATCPR